MKCMLPLIMCASDASACDLSQCMNDDKHAMREGEHAMRGLYEAASMLQKAHAMREDKHAVREGKHAMREDKHAMRGLYEAASMMPKEKENDLYEADPYGVFMKMFIPLYVMRLMALHILLIFIFIM